MQEKQDQKVVLISLSKSGCHRLKLFKKEEDIMDVLSD